VLQRWAVRCATASPPCGEARKRPGQERSPERNSRRSTGAKTFPCEDVDASSSVPITGPPPECVRTRTIGSVVSKARGARPGWPAPRGSSSCRWPVSGLQAGLRAFPHRSVPMQWQMRSVRSTRLLTVAGAAQVGSGAGTPRLLFPVSPKASPTAPSTDGSLATDSPAAAPHSGGSLGARGDTMIK
jgi:hypothetical protein